MAYSDEETKSLEKALARRDAEVKVPLTQYVSRYFSYPLYMYHIFQELERQLEMQAAETEDHIGTAVASALRNVEAASGNQSDTIEDLKKELAEVSHYC